MSTISSFLMSLLSKAGLEFYGNLDSVDTAAQQVRDQTYQAMYQAMVKEQNFSAVWFEDAVSRAEEIIEKENEKLHGKQRQGVVLD